MMLSSGFGAKVGIETVCCSGYTYSCKKPGATPKSSHEWNCIKIDGIWTPCDSTWAAGSVGADFTFSKRYDDFWWMTPPEHFIFTHLSEDPQVHRNALCALVRQLLVYTYARLPILSELIV